ncbi:FAD-dependent oxidoreductase [Halomonas sp. E19]|uniref:FAD-dependent oxidoreductase n=1 Tax=Halomonas sp. E19 TaxID=3397247 RepID=UPI004033BEE4
MDAIWKLGSKGVAQYAPLDRDMSVDVVVIGAGITGLTTAMALAEAGQHVMVLEALSVGAGVTGVLPEISMPPWRPGRRRFAASGVMRWPVR